MVNEGEEMAGSMYMAEVFIEAREWRSQDEEDEWTTSIDRGRGRVHGDVARRAVAGLYRCDMAASSIS